LLIASRVAAPLMTWVIASSRSFCEAANPMTSLFGSYTTRPSSARRTDRTTGVYLVLIASPSISLLWDA